MMTVPSVGLPARLGAWLRLSLIGFALVTAQGAPADAAPAYAVKADGLELVRFDTDDTAVPKNVTSLGAITGLPAGFTVYDLDIRPKTGLLYALAGDGATAGIYRLTFSGGVAPIAMLVTTFATFPGTAGVMDFDPTNVANDHIRVFNGAGNNGYRVDPDAPPNVAPTAVPSVVGANLVGVAFTNNFRTPNTTVIYGIDAAPANQLVTVPDAGGAVSNPLPLGVTADAISGLDITANFGEALALLPGSGGAAGPSALYSIDLTTGAATNLGDIGTGATGRLHGLTVYTRASIVYGISGTNDLIVFLSAVPSTLCNADCSASGPPRPITGLAPGETITAIDTRPSTGELFGVTSANRLIVIDPANAQATRALTLTGDVPLDGTAFGMYFEAGTPERIYLTSNNSKSYRIDPDSAGTTLVGDTGAFHVVGMAPGRVVTWMISNDAVDTFGTIIPSTSPSATIFTWFALGFSITDASSLDSAPSDQTVYAALTPDTAPAATDFYAIRPEASPATRMTKIGPLPIGGVTPQLVRAMAVASIGRVRINPAAYTVNEGPNPLTPVPISIERIGGTDGPLTVELRTIDGTAIDNTDFVGARTIYTFLPGASPVATVSPALITNDTMVEPDKTFEVAAYDVSLSSSASVDPLLPNATVTILDDDSRMPTIQITSPTTGGTFEANSLFIALAGVAADPDGQITSVTWQTDHGASGVASAPVGASTDWIINVVPLVQGANTITVTAHDNSTPTPRTASATLIVNVGELTYFMAEGATGFFNLDILIANPSSIAANVEVQFFDANGAIPGVQQFQVPANARRTLTVNDIPGMDGRQISTIVTSKNAVPLIVERTMEWDRATRYGSATDHATDGANRKWYFAEGAQGAFNTYLLLVNPNDGPNVAHVRYLRDNEPVISVDYPLIRFQRFTADIGNVTDFPGHAGLQNRVFGIEVTFDLPGVAERAMYFGFPPLWRGGHESAGVNLPSRSWFLAEGATGFFQTYVLLANPSAQNATVNVDYLLPGGMLITSPAFQLPAGQRTSVDVAGADPRLAATAVSTRVTSTAPIIVERAQYWPAGPFDGWQEAHNSFGMPEPGTSWGLAEGRVGGERGYSTYILLANPGTQPATGTIKFLRENGASFSKPFVVPANGRYTVLGEDLEVPELVNESFGAVITSDLPIVVERAMYSNALGVTWQAGSNATATRLPAVIP